MEQQCMDYTLTEEEEEVVSREQYLHLPTIRDIPVDTLNLVTSFLQFPDLINLSVCSKRLYWATRNTSHLFVDDRLVVRRAGDCKMSTITCHRHNFCSSSCSLSLSSSSSALIPFGCFRMSTITLTQLLSQYQNLISLNLSGVGPIGDSLFPILNHSKCSSRLKYLTVHGINLTHKCQEALKLENLEELNLVSGSLRSSLDLLIGIDSNIPFTTSKSAVVSSKPVCNLKRLSIYECSSLCDEPLSRFLYGLGNSLTHLVLNHCLLQAPVLVLPRLEDLSLMGCFALQHLPSFRCPSLRSLNLSFCFRLSDECLGDILRTLPALEELKLVKSSMLRNLKLASKTLKFLDVSHCDSLSLLHLRCPQLESLNTDSCFSLETLMIKQGWELHELFVSELPLTRLKLVAPYLNELNLIRCTHLESCSIHAPRLQHLHLHGTRTAAIQFYESMPCTNTPKLNNLAAPCQ